MSDRPSALSRLSVLRKLGWLRGLSLSILIALALLLSAASNGGSDKKHQNQPRTHDRSANGKTNPATPTVNTIVVQPAPVQIIQPSAPIEKKKPQGKWYQRPTITDWGIFVVTILYTSISLGLLHATRRQAQLGKDALIETRQAVAATEKAAQAAKESAEASQQQAATLQLSLAMTHRPRLRIRSVGIRYEISNRSALNGYFTIANYGGLDAALIEAAVRFWMEQLPMTPPARGDEESFVIQIPEGTMRAGQSWPIVMVTTPLCDMNAVTYSNHYLFLMGYVNYRGPDPNGPTYRTSFCRRFDPKERRFVKVNEPDYEYEE